MLDQEILLHLQILPQGVVLGIALGHGLERLGHPLVSGGDLGIVHDGQELIGLGIDEATQLVQDVFLGPPDAAAQHHLVDAEVDIVAGLHRVAATLADDARKVSLVGALVMGETDVAVDAIDAILDGQATRLGVKIGHAGDEALHVLLPRAPQGVVGILARLEPGPVIINSQLAQERHNFGNIA